MADQQEQLPRQAMSGTVTPYDYENNLSGVGVFDAGGTVVTQALCLRHDPMGHLVMVGTVPSAYLGARYWDAGLACTIDSPWVQTPVVRFTYDHRGRRIARWVASTERWTYIISDRAGNPISELLLAGGTWQPVRDYVWLDSRPLAQVEYPGPGGSQQGYTYYYGLDHLGLPLALTNQSQQVVWAATRRPYGDIAETTSVDPLSGRTVVTNLRLPGQYDERLLGSLGLQGPYYNWNRWYLPSVGRYMELEPLLENPRFVLGMGLRGVPVAAYSYANNNPNKYTDKDGRCALDSYTCCLNENPGHPERCGGTSEELTRRLLRCEERALECNLECSKNGLGGCFDTAREFYCKLWCDLEAEACRRGVVLPN